MASWLVGCCIALVPVVPGCASWFPDCGSVLLRERECRSALGHRESCVWLSAWLCCVVCRVLVSVRRVVACDECGASCFDPVAGSPIVYTRTYEDKQDRT